MRQIKTARRRKKGTKYFHITAMLMAYLTYEAYINFLGDRFAPDVWKNEREFFSKKPYKGIQGKLKKILERCPMPDLKKGQRPYQTIMGLKKLRDFLSHCKPDKYTKTIIHNPDNIDILIFGKYDKIEQLVSKEKAEAAVKDVRELIEFLHEHAAQHTNDKWFGSEALGGIRGHSSHDSRIKN